MSSDVDIDALTAAAAHHSTVFDVLWGKESRSEYQALTIPKWCGAAMVSAPTSDIPSRDSLVGMANGARR
ncbi:hypothetical protein PG987_007921 [Apiospora arundinis]